MQIYCLMLAQVDDDARDYNDLLDSITTPPQLFVNLEDAKQQAESDWGGDAPTRWEASDDRWELHTSEPFGDYEQTLCYVIRRVEVR